MKADIVCNITMGACISKLTRILRLKMKRFCARYVLENFSDAIYMVLGVNPASYTQDDDKIWFADSLAASIPGRVS